MSETPPDFGACGSFRRTCGPGSGRTGQVQNKSASGKRPFKLEGLVVSFEALSASWHIFVGQILADAVLSTVKRTGKAILVVF